MPGPGSRAFERADLGGLERLVSGCRHAQRHLRLVIRLNGREQPPIAALHREDGLEMRLHGLHALARHKRGTRPAQGAHRAGRELRRVVAGLCATAVRVEATRLVRSRRRQLREPGSNSSAGERA